MIVSFTRERARSRWIYVDTVKRPEFGELVSGRKTLGVLAGRENRRLVPE